MDERLLVKRAKRGDTAAFAELYGTIYKRLYQFALYTLGNTQDAEDVVSAAVMEAFEKYREIAEGRCFFRLDVSYRGKYVQTENAGILSTGRRTDGRKTVAGTAMYGVIPVRNI